MSENKSIIHPNDFPEMIFIPAGPFWMGSEVNDLAAHDNEKPRHEVMLEDFKIGRCPVTNAQYAAFIGVTRYPSPWDDKLPPAHLMDHPVVNVSYIEAKVYCHWLSQATGKLFRLPTEYEWEKAARGAKPNARRHTWDTGEAENRCNTKETGIGGTTPVTKYENVSASPYGVADMLGNVWEWTENWYGRYSLSTHDSINYGRAYKVVRGGSWNNPLKRARISCRGRYKPGAKRPYLGFRVATEVVTQYDNLDYLKNILLPKLIKHFNASELQTLCFELDINYESLPEDPENMARELIFTCHHLVRVESLVQLCQQYRPNIIW